MTPKDESGQISNVTFDYRIEPLNFIDPWSILEEKVFILETQVKRLQWVLALVSLTIVVYVYVILHGVIK